MRALILSAGAAALCTLVPVASSQAGTVDPPQFRTGLWHFERTLEWVRRPPATSTVFSKTEATRCVDPNVAMAGIFSSPSLANCHSEKPQVFGNQYVFPNRCDFMGPVSTVITAQSETA